MIFDTHCHLDQLSASQLRSQLNSNNLYLTMGTSSANWNNVIQLSSTYDNIYPALGLHPWFVDQSWNDQVDLLRMHIDQNSINAIGEIGLDFSKPYIHNKELQIQALDVQLALAEKYQLPVSLHVYKAHTDLLKLLKNYTVTGVIHSLGSSIEIAQSYLNLGYKIGVNGIIVRDNARRYHQLVARFGLEHFVLETDAPNILLPGHTEAQLSDIYSTLNQVSNLTGLVTGQVESITTNNARVLFKL
ncbi:MAG: TatD family hydrolase [Pseudomonadota bacterium]|nr:TatD family hydrolase [Pseudomonadota bacterium]